MDESDAAWQQVAIGQLPADADQRGNLQFYLVPIRKPLNADKGAGQRKVFPIAAHVQGNGFIDYRAVALRSIKGVAQQFGRIPHIVEQPDLAKIIVACKMKSEKIVMQCDRDQFDKFDLTLRREPNVLIFDLLARDSGLHHQGLHVDAADMARAQASRDNKPAAHGRS
jgi:hypothetical protein